MISALPSVQNLQIYGAQKSITVTWNAFSKNMQQMIDFYEVTICHSRVKICEPVERVLPTAVSPNNLLSIARIPRWSAAVIDALAMACLTNAIQNHPTDQSHDEWTDSRCGVQNHGRTSQDSWRTGVQKYSGLQSRLHNGTTEYDAHRVVTYE